MLYESSQNLSPHARGKREEYSTRVLPAASNPKVLAFCSRAIKRGCCREIESIQSLALPLQLIEPVAQRNPIACPRPKKKTPSLLFLPVLVLAFTSHLSTFSPQKTRLPLCPSAYSVKRLTRYPTQPRGDRLSHAHPVNMPSEHARQSANRLGP